MPVREFQERFLVAFSFAGEQRELVRPVVEEVERRLGRSTVFYDEWFEHYIAGEDGDLTLQEVYAERCVLAVVCVSERYGGKPWTKVEHRAIRARQMKAEQARDRLGILPIRVGEGEVGGIPFNSIVPDIRERSPEASAQLILDRLGLILPNLGEGSEPSGWPETPPTLEWPICDHRKVSDAFTKLLTRESPFRFLPVCGHSELGKTQITKSMQLNALQMSEIVCGRFDFKGGAGLDNEVAALATQVEAPKPPASLSLNGRLSNILAALKDRGQPTLLIFDTYEDAGEAVDWLENQLLPGLIRADWLRVVIAGQKAPERGDAIVSAVSAPLIELESPPPEDWFEYGKPHKAGITLAFVRQLYECVGQGQSVGRGVGARKIRSGVHRTAAPARGRSGRPSEASACDGRSHLLRPARCGAGVAEGDARSCSDSALVRWADSGRVAGDFRGGDR